MGNCRYRCVVHCFTNKLGTHEPSQVGRCILVVSTSWWSASTCKSPVTSFQSQSFRKKELPALISEIYGPLWVAQRRPIAEEGAPHRHVQCA